MPIGESPEVNSHTRGALCVGNCGAGAGAELPLAIPEVYVIVHQLPL